MDAVQQIHEAANVALGKAIEELDKKIRPVQRAYFACCYASSHETFKADDVPDKIGLCQRPMLEVQQMLSAAQQEFQGNIGKCHQAAGAAVKDVEAMHKSGKPTTEQLEQYAGALRPCVEGEVTKIASLLAPVYAQAPKSLAEVQAVTPAAGLAGLESSGAKKGWFS